MIAKSRCQWVRMVVFLIFMGMSLAVFPVSATIFFEDGANRTVSDVYDLMNTTKPADNARAAVFFYDPECDACTPAHDYLKTYIAQHPGTNVEMVNLSDGQGAKDRLNDLYTAYHREWLNIPVIFIGQVGLEGTDEITNGFEEVYTWNAGKRNSGEDIWDMILKFLGFK